MPKIERGSFNGVSNSEQYLANKSETPQISALVGKSVSEQRKQAIAEQIKNGEYREGSGSPVREDRGLAVVSTKTLTKNAQAISNQGGLFHGANGDVVKQAPEVYSPLWLNSNLNLPRDRATINAWCRSFFALNPFVRNAINLHSTYPISKLNIKCPNKDIEKFFNDMIEEIDLMNICVQIAQEYWLLGEAFVYSELDEGKGKWNRLAIQNPDYIVVQRTVAADEPAIYLRPDPNLQKVIMSNRSMDIEQQKKLPTYILDAVRRGGNIPLDNFNVSHLAQRISPYEIRGTGLPVCIFRQLMLFDQLRESKYVQASSMINPTTVVKIGSADFKPTSNTLEEYRMLFEQAAYDRNFTIFTHEAVDISRVGWGQGIYDISGDITQIVKEIYIGLQVPSVVIEGGGEYASYATGGIALDVLRQRYIQFRNMLSAWLKRKIFAPISKIQGFFDYAGGEKQLIVPEIDWNHMSLFDTGDLIQNLLQLTQGDEKSKRVSLHTLYRSLGMDYNDEVRKMRKETIQTVIASKEKTALDAMDLNAIRALTDDDEIPEPEKKGEQSNSEPPVPGQSADAGGGGSGMPDLSLPGSPPPPVPASTPPAAPSSGGGGGNEPPAPPAPPPTA